MNEYVSAEIWHRIHDVTYHYQAIWNKVPKENKLHHTLSPTTFSSKQLCYQNMDTYLTLKGKEIFIPCVICIVKTKIMQEYLKKTAPLFDVHKSNENGLEN